MCVIGNIHVLVETRSVVEIRTARELGLAARDRRVQLGLTQAEVSRRAGVSRKWLSEFEAGKASARLQNVLSTLDALRLQWSLSYSDDEFTVAERKDLTSEPIDLDALLEGFTEPAVDGVASS